MGTVLVSMLFYMGGAFANASFYLNKWSDVSRSMIAFFGIFIIMLVWCALVIFILNRSVTERSDAMSNLASR